MNDADFPVAEVLAGIDAAERAGLGPLKVNMVVKRGTNDHEIVPMARHFRGRNVVLRFIEYMDVGATNGWRMDEVLPSAEVIARLGEAFPLRAHAGQRRRRDRRALALRRAGGRRDRHDLERHARRSATTATGRACRPRASSSSACSRAAATTCARCCAAAPATPRSPRRSASIWQGRDDRYSELRGRAEADAGSGERRVEMHYIGG